MPEIKLSEIAKILEKYEVAELCGVKINGDIEIEISQGGDTAGIQIALGQGAAQLALTLLNIA